MFEEGLAKKIGCSGCNLCNLKNKLGNVSAWQYGNNFKNNKYKILFVGKTARGYYDKPEELYNKPWAYWSYTRNICESLSLNWEDICITNLIKCNTSATTDTTFSEMKENCIIKQKFIRKEIEYIQPLHIVFYTHTYYDKEIPYIFDNIENLNNTDKEFKIKCGNKQIPYWEFKAKINDNIVYCLRLSHPERKNKNDFVNIVKNFIIKTNP